MTTFSKHFKCPDIFICFLLLFAPAVRAQEPDLALPFPSGTSFRCSQGPGGTYSHHGVRTRYALDFAAPEGTRILAAAAGVAHVFHDVPDPTFHPEDCPTATSRNFGNHVTIDHGNGYFTIYAHFHTFAPGIDGQPVVKGQFLGTVDSTGWSCGNHLHFGLHQGDATRVIGSVSIVSNRILAAVSPAGTPTFLKSTDFRCGPEGVGASYAPPPATDTTRNYLTFVNGDPGIPGDGRTVTADEGGFLFTLSSPLPLGGLTQGFYIAAFPPPGTPTQNEAGYDVVAPGRFDVSGNRRSLCGVSVGTFAGSITVNGVKGYFVFFDPRALPQFVADIRSIGPGCNVFTGDLALTGISVFTGTESVSILDAAFTSMSPPQ